MRRGCESTTVRFRASSSSSVLPSSSARFWFSLCMSSYLYSVSWRRVYIFYTVSLKNLFSLAIGSYSNIFLKKSFAWTFFWIFSSRLISSSGVFGVSCRSGCYYPLVSSSSAATLSSSSSFVKRLMMGRKAWQSRSETFFSCFSCSILWLMISSFCRSKFLNYWFSRLRVLNLLVSERRSSCSDTD